MKQHCSQTIASTDRGFCRAGFAVSAGQAAVQSRHSFILSQNFLARALVLGLLLISILR